MILDTSNEDRYSDVEEDNSFSEDFVIDSDDSIKCDLIDMRKSYDDIFELEKHDATIEKDNVNSNLLRQQGIYPAHDANYPFNLSLPNISSVKHLNSQINSLSQQNIDNNNKKSSLYYLAKRCKEISKLNNLKKYLPNFDKKKKSIKNHTLRKKNSEKPGYERPNYDQNTYEKTDMQTNIKRYKREYKKKSHRKNIVVSDPLSIEIEETIESFADFSDSMFRYKVQDTTKMYLCPESNCEVELPSLSRIKRHYLVHTNLKPFKCMNPRCEKRFSRKDNMLQHYRTHCKSKKR